MRSLESEIELWTGIKHKIPICCLLFYECVWYPSIKSMIDDYAKTMTKLSNNQGIILCPDCILKEIVTQNKKSINSVIA